MKIYIEKQPGLGFPLINGLLKYWPITCPGKEVIFINEIEEILELIGKESETRFDAYGDALIKRLL